MADEPGGKPSDLPAFLQDHEKVEEAKYYPPAPPAAREGTGEEGELPDYSGDPKVTLLPVGPYLAYAYWEFDMAMLPPDTTSAVLRFHEAPESSVGGGFDVNVDLRAGSWYVHLWKPAEPYVADLGVKTAGGDFISLARSNPLQTPRAWPVADIATEETPPAETPAAIEAEIKAEVPAEPVSAERAAEAVSAESASGAVFAALATEAVSAEPAIDATVETPTPPQELPASAAPEAETAAQEPEPPKHGDAVEVLQAKLAEIYSLRQWTPRAATAAAVAAGPMEPPSEIPETRMLGLEASQTNLEPSQTSFEDKDTRREPRPGHAPAPPRPPAHFPTPADLTQLAETRFSPGLSSALPPQRRPEEPG